MKRILLIGTYSNIGLHKLTFDNGTLTTLLSDDKFENCSYLSNYKNINFSVIEYFNDYNKKNSLIVARNSNLSIINTLDIKGISPCYVRLDISRNLLYIANYGDGSLNVFSLNPDKSLGKLIFYKCFTNKSHIHCIELSKDGNFLFITDLGDNKLFAYKIIFSETSFNLIHISQYNFPNDEQPRHIVVNNDNIFLITEASCELYHFTFSETNGFNLLGKSSILPENVPMSDSYTGCAIKLSKNKNFIYTSLRGLDIICVFSITNKLNLRQHISCYGKTPRDILVLDNYLLCANQNSNSITIFDANENTGELCYKNTFNIDHPACIIQL